MKYNYPVLEALFYYGIYVLFMIPFVFADLCVDNKRACRICIFIGASMMCVFAGIRGQSVGTDTPGTLLEFFWPSLPYKTWSQVLSADNELREPFYLYLSFLLQKITRKDWIFQLFMQVVTTGPIAVLAYQNRHKSPVSMTMFAFMMLFYQASFNIARHCAAAAFMLLAVHFYREHRWIRAILLHVCALFLHSSAKYGTVLFLAVYLFIRIRNKALKNVVRVLLLIALGYAVMNWKSVTMQLTQLSFFERLGGYAQKFTTQTGENLQWFVMRPRTIFDEALRVAGFLIIAFMLKDHEKYGDRTIQFIKYSMLVSVMIFTFFVIAIQSYMGNRISLYYDFLWIPAFSFLCSRDEIENVALSKYEKVTMPRGNISLNTIVAVLYCISYNAVIYMFTNWGNTLPYKVGAL